MSGRPINLGLTGAISRIGGFDSPRIPALLDGIQPVIVYGDVSRSVASEMLEARGCFSQNQFAAATNFCGFEITARSPGGIVFDTFILGQQGGQFLDLAVVPASLLSAPTVPAILNVGGIPADSTVELDDSIAGYVRPAGAQTLPVLTSATTIFLDLTLARIFLPSGAILGVYSSGNGNKLSCFLVWRELEDVQGAI